MGYPDTRSVREFTRNFTQTLPISFLNNTYLLILQPILSCFSLKTAIFGSLFIFVENPVCFTHTERLEGLLKLLTQMKALAHEISHQNKQITIIWQTSAGYHGLMLISQVKKNKQTNKHQQKPCHSPIPVFPCTQSEFLWYLMKNHQIMREVEATMLRPKLGLIISNHFRARLSLQVHV